ncbi:MAG: hypothetical protein ACXWUG_06715 [Polyangiales bacterium]
MRIPLLLSILLVAPGASASDQGSEERDVGLTLTATGAMVAGLGVTGLVVAGARMSRNRDRLATEYRCGMTGDFCETIRDPQRVAEAQSLSDQIAIWRNVRTGAIAATAVGAGLALVGVVTLATSCRTPRRPNSKVTPMASALPGAGFIGLMGSF